MGMSIAANGEDECFRRRYKRDVSFAFKNKTNLEDLLDKYDENLVPFLKWGLKIVNTTRNSINRLNKDELIRYYRLRQALTIKLNLAITGLLLDDMNSYQQMTNQTWYKHVSIESLPNEPVLQDVNAPENSVAKDTRLLISFFHTFNAPILIKEKLRRHLRGLKGGFRIILRERALNPELRTLVAINYLNPSECSVFPELNDDNITIIKKNTLSSTCLTIWNATLSYFKERVKSKGVLFTDGARSIITNTPSSFLYFSDLNPLLISILKTNRLFSFDPPIYNILYNTFQNYCYSQIFWPARLAYAVLVGWADRYIQNDLEHIPTKTLSNPFKQKLRACLTLKNQFNHHFLST